MVALGVVQMFALDSLVPLVPLVFVPSLVVSIAPVHLVAVAAAQTLDLVAVSTA